MWGASLVRQRCAIARPTFIRLARGPVPLPAYKPHGTAFPPHTYTHAHTLGNVSLLIRPPCMAKAD
eukprot:194040-Chlamydomonas_euryale.AAC.1